jgi:hypothetical protein
MQSVRRVVPVVVLILAPLFAAGCAKPPQEAIDQTRTSFEAARESDAGQWAEAEWEAAQTAMAAVDAELEKQSAKMSITRSFKDTERLLGEASAKVEAAATTATANREEARRSAQADLDATRQALASARTLTEELGACPRKPKGFAADMELMTGSLSSLEQDLAGVESTMESEDYRGVSTDALALKAQIDTLITDMQAAKTKIGC